MAIEIKPGFISSVADNPTDFANGLLTPSRHNLPCTLSGLTAGQLLVPTSATSLTSYAGLTFDGTKLSFGEVAQNYWPALTSVSNPTLSGINFNNGVLRYVYNSEVKAYYNNGDFLQMSKVHII